jgi:hypothetical protein
MVDAPLNAYLRVPPPTDPESQQGHLDGELQKIERTTRETLTRLGTLATTYAPIASPVFTGDPQAPTPLTADNDTSIATTAYVKAQDYATNTALTTGLSTAATNLSTGLGTKAATVHTHAQSDVTGLVSALAGLAPLASAALTGTPTAPTAAAGTNTTQLATTAYVAGGVPTRIYKTADQSSTTRTLADVTDLAFPMVANGKYGFQFCVMGNLAGVGEYFVLNGPSGLVRLRVFINGGGFAYATSYLGTISSTFVGSGVFGATFVGVITNGTTAGNLRVQYGQAGTVDSATAVTVEQGSWIEYKLFT